jgi:hypothetical protein
MQKYIINGSISESSKELKFIDVVPIVRGENAITELHIELPTGYEEQEISAYLLIKDEGGKPIISEKIEPHDNVLKYVIKNTAPLNTGTLYTTLLINKIADDETETFKTPVNKQLYVSQSICEDEAIPPEQQESLLSDITRAINTAQAAANDALEVKNQLLQDKEDGLFNGEKGDKGDPSTLDKMGAAVETIDLSDIEQGIFGTIDTPITIDETTTIQFIGLDLALGYQKSFIIYVKRTADVSVIWQDVKGWAYDEIPLLPVGQVQKILVETSNGINYYGTWGDSFDV